MVEDGDIHSWHLQIRKSENDVDALKRRLQLLTLPGSSTATGIAGTCYTGGSTSKPSDKDTLWPDSEGMRMERSGWLVTQYEGEDSVS
jgi:hypothetical protein